MSLARIEGVMLRAIDPEPVAPDTPKPIVTDVAIALSPLVRRIIAANPEMMTGPGTNTYLVGIDEIVVIDPGPDDEAHLDAIAGCGGDRIRWIVCTHTHPDHSPGAAGLAERTAPVLAFDARDELEIDRSLGDGDTIEATEFRLEAVHTPGTRRTTSACSSGRSGCSSRATTSWKGRPWSSAHPTVTWPHTSRRSTGCALAAAVEGIAPGHGLRIDDPKAKLDEYVEHRLARERQIADTLRAAGTATPEALVESIYTEVAEELHPVARKTVWAHLRKLADDGEVTGEDPDDIDAAWSPRP